MFSIVPQKVTVILNGNFHAVTCTLFNTDTNSRLGVEGQLQNMENRGTVKQLLSSIPLVKSGTTACCFSSMFETLGHSSHWLLPDSLVGDL